MICELFEKLTPKEKTEFIGQLVHSVQSDEALYAMGQEIIRLGKLRGLFEGVIILPEDSKKV